MSDSTTSPAPPPDPLARHGGRKNLKYAVYGVRPVDYAYWAELGVSEAWQNGLPLPPEGSDWEKHLRAAQACGMKVRLPASLPRAHQKAIVGGGWSEGLAGWMATPDEIDNKVIANNGGTVQVADYVKVVQATHGLKGPQGRYPVLGTFGHNARHLSSQPFLVDCYAKTLRSLDAWAFDEYRGADAGSPQNEQGLSIIAGLWDCTLYSMHSLAGNGSRPWWLFVETGDIFNKGDGKHGATTEYVEFAIRYAHDRGAEGVCFFPLKVRGEFKWNVTTPETAQLIKLLTRTDLIELRHPSPARVERVMTSVRMSDGSELITRGVPWPE
jgi:hypothetical protein